MNPDEPTNCSGAPLDYATLDPGIADIVRVFREAGFDTSDSGDGRHKLARGDDPAEVTPFPRVVIPTSTDDLIRTANQVLAFIRERWPAAELQPSLYLKEDGETWGGVVLVSWPAPAAPTWTTFWWESNACWGEVNDRRSWQEMVELYRGAHEPSRPLVEVARDMITRGRRCISEMYKRPDFGTRAEHQGCTLAEWAKAVGLDLLDGFEPVDADVPPDVEMAPAPPVSGFLGADIAAFAKEWPPGDDWYYEAEGGVEDLERCSPGHRYAADELGLICWQGEGAPQGCLQGFEHDDAYNFSDWLGVWLKDQTTTRLAVELPNEHVDALRAFLATIGGSAT